MIRLLVLVLVAANLFYLGWSQWVAEEKPRLVAPSTLPSTVSTPPPLAATAEPAPCTAISMGHDETRSMQIEQLLRDMQLSPVRRSVTEEVREGWWVFVINANAATQSRTLRAIQAAGIRDAFAMADDPEFRVSVGLFMEEAGARSRAEAVRALKLDATVQERMQQQTTVWFDLPGTARGALDLARLGAEGVEVQDLRVTDCPAGAEAPVDEVVPEDAAGMPAPPQV